MKNLPSLNLLSAATLLVALVLGGEGAARANLLTNGSFEDTTNFTPNSGNDTMVLTPGQPSTDTAMTGWTVVNGQVAWIGPTNPFGVVAPDGSYSLDLTSYNAGAPWGAVEQTVTTISGASYQLQFELGSYPSNDSVVTASATGTAGATYQNSAQVYNDWMTYTYDFTASGTSTTVELLGATNGYNNYIGLDDADLTLTSLPQGGSSVPDAASSAGLLVLGLGILILVGKRRSAFV